MSPRPAYPLDFSQKSSLPPNPAQVSAPTQKPTLVLVHGFRGSPLGLKTIADILRRAGYTVHTPALPPFAGAKLNLQNSTQSDPRATQTNSQNNLNSRKKKANLNVTPQDYARYLRDYLQEHSLVRPILIGHSMGSVVATATAKYYPKSINQKLVLLSPISTKPPRPIASISPLANYLPTKAVDYITTRFLFVPRDRALLRETLTITHQCSSDQHPSKADLSYAMKFSTSYSVADFLDHIQNDIIMIAGAKDRLIRQKDTQALAEKYSAHLELITNAGHLHNYEKPHETAELILRSIQ